MFKAFKVALELCLLITFSKGSQRAIYLRCSYSNVSQCTPVFSQKSSSQVECTVACNVNPTCKSFLHSKSNSTCIGCGQVFGSCDGVSANADPRYYRPFANYREECDSVEKPCLKERTTCFPGVEKCVCSPFYDVYDRTSESCVRAKECETLGSTFQKYPSIYLKLTNGWTDVGVTDVSWCLQKCASGAFLFECYSVEYNRVTLTCTYNNKAVPDSHFSLVNGEFDEIYIRNCQ